MNINEPATIMIFAALISLLLSLYAWRKKQNNAGKYLSLLLLSSAIWSLFYGFEIYSTDIEIMKIYLFISYFGITSLPVFWLLFALRYTGSEKWLKTNAHILLFTVPLLTMVMQATNQFHSLFYKSITLGEINNINYLKLEPGVFWWINIGYSHILTLAGLILFIQFIFKLEKEQKIPVFFFLASALLPYIVNVFYISGIRPFGFLDLTPVAFMIMGFIIIYGVIVFKLFDINPLAIDLFFKNTPDVIFVRNSQGNIVNSNPAAQKLFNNFSTVNPNFNVNNKKIADSLIFNDATEMTEIKIFGKQYEKTVTNINNQRGKNIGTLIMLRDITKAKEAQEEIEKLVSLQNLLMRMASNYINLKIEEIEDGIKQSLFEIGTYAEADRAYVFNYNWEKYTCSNTYEWCANDINSEIENLQDVSLTQIPDWIETHKKGKPLIVSDVFLLPKESMLRQILEPQGIKTLITIPIMQNNYCHGFIGFDFVKNVHLIKEYEKTLLTVYADILINLFERANLEKNLIKEKENANAANKAKSEFLANMSHEIRTPMNSILGFAEVILNTTAEKHQKNYLKTILNSGKTLLSLINDILDLSKIEAGRLEFFPEPTNLKILINEIGQLFLFKLKEKNIDFSIEIDKEFPDAIIIDDLRIRQILLNLIGNAVKFTNAGFVKVKIEVLQKRENLVDIQIKVIDTGIGIEKNNYDSLFETFSQQSGQISRKYGGTGLGLAITKRLVELMNGEVYVESEIDKGSCFTVRFLELQTAKSGKIKTDVFEWAENDIFFKPAKILVVDDILYNRQLVATFLKDYDFEFIHAINGVEAIEKALTMFPDIIFMDLRMPKMDGYAATEFIKNNEKTASIPIIALTASIMQSDLKVVQKSFDGYIQKPFNKQTLLSQLVKFLHFSELPQKSVHDSEMNEGVIKNNESKVLSDEMKQLFQKELGIDLIISKDSVIVDDILKIIPKLEAFATVHKIESLQIKTQQLKSFIEEFDLDEMHHCLYSINELFS
jgi:signal transduction histidine kinase/CheY-like chemotaxis protein/PAS domain-containing protein